LHRQPYSLSQVPSAPGAWVVYIRAPAVPVSTYSN
jgi:hypothetical protein